jgi:hypothetical protein
MALSLSVDDIVLSHNIPRSLDCRVVALALHCLAVTRLAVEVAPDGCGVLTDGCGALPAVSRPLKPVRPRLV